MLNINLEYVKGILFVRIKGDLNRSTSKKLNSYLVPVIMKHGIKYLVYNLYELESIDDYGLRSLQHGTYAINANNGISYICEIPKILQAKLKNISINKISDELTAVNLIQI